MQGPTEIEPETNFNLTNYALYLDGKTGEYGRRLRTDNDYFFCLAERKVLTAYEQSELLQEVQDAETLAQSEATHSEH